jgi:hypothetical protein
LLSSKKEAKQSVVSLIDRWMPIIIKVYNPLFFGISLIGFCLMFLGITPSGFGIPLIFWTFSFIGHVVQFSFTKKIGTLSLISCVLCADWIVGSLFNRLIENIDMDHEGGVRFISGIALIGFIVLSLLYLKIVTGLKPPVTKEYTWEDFKFDYSERKEEWSNRMEVTIATLRNAREKAKDVTGWIKEKIARKKNKEPILYLPPPREDQPSEQPELIEPDNEQSEEMDETPVKFRIITSKPQEEITNQSAESQPDDCDGGKGEEKGPSIEAIQDTDDRNMSDDTDDQEACEVLTKTLNAEATGEIRPIDVPKQEPSIKSEKRPNKEFWKFG